MQRLQTLLLALFVCVSSGWGQAKCSISSVNYKGWAAQRIQNAWLTLFVVPQLGGRLMQVSFGPHSYLFVNPVYEGKYFSPAQGAALGKWFNYGGDKIWPLPEGAGEKEWPGGSDVLDDGEYTARVISTGERCTLHLQGPPDPRTGIEYQRDISIDANTPHIRFHAVMNNASAHSIEWSMQSVSQYDTSDPQHPDNYNHDFWVFTPANPASAYLNGYHIRSGPAEHSSFAIRDHLFILHWTYLESEVWLDSPGDWVAVVDGRSQFAMVERSRVQPRAEYPGKATVIFYIDGQSLHMDADSVPRLSPPNPRDTPYYMEAELNSPLARLQPGQSFAFDTEWFATRAGTELRDVTDAGVIMRPFTAVRHGATARITGSFGVAFAGQLVLHWYNDSGTQIGATTLSRVSPLNAVVLDQETAAPATAARVAVHLEDDQHHDYGSLGEYRMGG